MDFKDSGSNSHVQFEILGSSFSETFGKDIKRVSVRVSLCTERRGGDGAGCCCRTFSHLQACGSS